MFSRSIRVAMLGTFLLLGAPSLESFARTGQSERDAIAGIIVERIATVETIDLTTRDVLLRSEDGKLRTVWIGPDVQRLNELKPGDKIIVRHTEALAVRMTRPDKVDKPPLVDAGAGTADASRPPAAVTGGQRTSNVRIQEFDPRRNLVTLIDPNGVARYAVVDDPRMQAFARLLKPGDWITVTYREAAAAAVEPVRH